MRFLLRLAPLVPRLGSAMRSAPSFLLRQFCLGKDANAQQLVLVREALATVTPDVLKHRLELVATRQAFGRMKFRIPCHYLQASEDKLIPATSARWFQHHFETCDVTSIRGPHFLLQTQPRRCAEWISEKATLLSKPAKTD